MTDPSEVAADAWWAGLPDTRRVQIYRWITDGGGHGFRYDPMPGETVLPLADLEPGDPPPVPRPVDTLESL